MSHTPGPWTIEWEDDNGEPYDNGVVIESPEGPVAFGVIDCSARLIAAAPELLERLRAMVSGLECECDTADPEHPMCDVCWSRQVIAQAEGRSD